MNVVAISDHIEQVSGRPVPQWLDPSKTILDFVHPDDRSRLLSALSETVGDASVHIPFRIVAHKRLDFARRGIEGIPEIAGGLPQLRKRCIALEQAGDRCREEQRRDGIILAKAREYPALFFAGRGDHRIDRPGQARRHRADEAGDDRAGAARHRDRIGGRRVAVRPQYRDALRVLHREHGDGERHDQLDQRRP